MQYGQMPYQQPQYNPYTQPYNPYMTPQQRLYALEQQYPQYGQTMPQNVSQAPPQVPQQGGQIMAVNSEQEARQYQTDLSGATQIFVNKTTNQIYAKQFDVSDATVKFETYEKSALNADAQHTTQDNPLIGGVLQGFTNQLNGIYEEIQNLKGLIGNGAKPDSNSKSPSRTKSTDAAGNAADSGNGPSGK